LARRFWNKLFKFFVLEKDIFLS